MIMLYVQLDNINVKSYLINVRSLFFLTHFWNKNREIKGKIFSNGVAHDLNKLEEAGETNGKDEQHWIS